MSSITETKINKSQISKVLSGSFLVAGTMIGAGMLGIPMATAQAGFIPSCVTTAGVWLFMLMTGLLLLEVCLCMPKGSNFLSISEYFLGKSGKYFVGCMFIFLYYCLLVAYIAGGVPLFSEIILKSSDSTWISYLVFSALFGFIVFLGIKWVDRINIILSVCMFCLFFWVIFIGAKSINTTNLVQHDFAKMFVSVPVLFGAFGYHNIIPSLCDYLERDRKTLSLALVLGSLASFIVYLAWQQTVLGSVSTEALQVAMQQGKTCIAALQEVTTNSNLYLFGKFFASTALATSLLGVSLSVVDFLQDGFSNSKIKIQRSWLCILAFAPSVFFAILNPTIFSKALGIAGGIGEAILNGIFPVIIAWIGFHYMQNSLPKQRYYCGKKYLLCLLLLGFLAMIIELSELF